MSNRKIFFLIISVIFIFSPFSISQNEEEIFRQANEYFRNKNYDEAIDKYLSLVNSGYEGTALYYNLGNSYYRVGQIGYAVLFYEKALKLSPGDDDIKHNLALANLRTIDRVESLPQFFLFEWWEGILSFFSSSEWIIVAYIFYLLLVLSIGFYFYVKSIFRQKITLTLGLITLLFLILSTSLLIIKLNRELNISNGVVVKNIVNVKLAPDIQSNDAFIIHEGLKIRFEDEVDKWIKIRLEDGKVGWIPADDARVI